MGVVQHALELRVRTRWRAALAALIVGVPAVILAGGLDQILVGARTAGLFAATTDADALTRVSATIVPSGVSFAWSARLLAAFAFAQLVHYAIWCWFLPRSAAGRAAARRVEAPRLGGAIAGWRFPALVAVLAGMVAGLAWADLRTGRTTYTSLAAYHALLEYPLLVLMVRHSGTARATEVTIAEKTPYVAAIRHLS